MAIEHSIPLIDNKYPTNPISITPPGLKNNTDFYIGYLGSRPAPITTAEIKEVEQRINTLNIWFSGSIRLYAQHMYAKPKFEQFQDDTAFLKGCYELTNDSISLARLTERDAFACAYSALAPYIDYNKTYSGDKAFAISDQPTLNALVKIIIEHRHTPLSPIGLPFNTVAFTPTQNGQYTLPNSATAATSLAEILSDITTLAIKDEKGTLTQDAISKTLAVCKEATTIARSNSELHSVRMEGVRCSTDQLKQMISLLPTDAKTTTKTAIKYDTKTRSYTMYAGPQQLKSELAISGTECKDTNALLAVLGDGTPKKLIFRDQAFCAFTDSDVDDLTIVTQEIRKTSFAEGQPLGGTLQLPQLKKLKLDKPTFVPESARETCLQVIFAREAPLHSLGLVNFGLKANHAAAVLGYLKTHPDLLELDLTGNSLCQEADFWVELAEILRLNPAHNLSSISPKPPNQVLLGALARNQQKPALEQKYQEAQKCLVELAARLDATNNNVDKVEGKLSPEVIRHPIQSLLAVWQEGYQKMLACVQFNIPNSTQASAGLKQYYEFLPKLVANDRQQAILLIQTTLLELASERSPAALKEKAVPILVAELEKIPSREVAEHLIEFATQKENTKYYDTAYRVYFQQLGRQLFASPLAPETQTSTSHYFRIIMAFLQDVGKPEAPWVSQANIQLAWSIISKVVQIQADEPSPVFPQSTVETKAEKKSVSSTSTAQSPTDLILGNFRDLSTPFILLRSNQSFATTLTMEDAQIINGAFLDLCKATCKRLATASKQSCGELNVLLKNIEVTTGLKEFVAHIKGFKTGFLSPAFLKPLKDHLKQVAEQAETVDNALMKVRPVASNPAATSYSHVISASSSPTVDALQHLQNECSTTTDLLKQVCEVAANSPDTVAGFDILVTEMNTILAEHLATANRKVNTASSSSAAKPTTSTSRTSSTSSIAASIAMAGGSPVATAISQSRTKLEPASNDPISYPQIGSAPDNEPA